MEMMAAGKTSILQRLFGPELRAWRGERGLAVVFWGYGVFASLLLILLHATALQRDQRAVQQAMIVISGLYTAWILVAIWRCARNAAPHWAVLARWLTVAWALNAAMVLLFLQIELLIRLWGR